MSLDIETRATGLLNPGGRSQAAHGAASPTDVGLERLLEFAARVFSAPIAALSVLGQERVVVHADCELGDNGIGRVESFCAKTLAQEDLLVVCDTAEDTRFASDPVAQHELPIRFLAGAPLRTASGQKAGALCLLDTKPRPDFNERDRRTFEDIAAYILHHVELRRLDRAQEGVHLRYERIASTSPDAILCADSEACITYWNSAAEKLFGYGGENAIGQPLGLIFPDRVRKLQTAEVMSIVNSRSSSPATRQLRLSAQRRDGGQFPAELSVSMWRDDGKVSFGAILRDITNRQHGEQRVVPRTELDPLTGLPGRKHLFDRLEQAAEAGAGSLMLIDIDRFTDINDSLGHSAGDLILAELADRLRSHCGLETGIARLGADEFAILLPGLADSVCTTQTAEELLRLCATPFSLNGSPVHLGANIGIAMFPAHGSDAEEICANANLALQRAKSTGYSSHQIYKPSLRQAVIARRNCESELRRAMAEEQFELHYQPQVRLSDGSIVGAEALLRWRHPERGLLVPSAFLAVLEASPLARDVGDWVLKSACADTAAWRSAGFPDFRIAVNLFGAQFNGGDLPTRVEMALLGSRLPAEAIELEITENIMLRHDESVIVALREMRAWGVNIAFDDYGTGYASLSLLKRYPVSRLKIDRSFVRDLCADSEDAAIVQAIMYLGRRFDLGVTAEGIESEAQEEVLRMYGCTEAQGFLYGKPVTAAALTGLLRQRRERTVA